ncbi:MAG: PEP/pyruvate-binding domain-containing protein [Caldisericia bacterium]
MLLTAKLKDSSEFELFGGKTVNLSKLMNAGFSVPDGFAVGTDAYLEFISENGLDTIIKSCLLAVDYSSQVSLDKYSEKIRSAFSSVSMPDEISAEIEAELKNFDRNFAVRSSATAEDLPTMSFAGLQDTYLNIHAEDIEEHIIKCFASLWTARAISYRHEKKIPQESIKIAVVVQEIIDADISGVAFTVNPITNDLDEMVINSNFGLGESVVSGKIEPDTVVYNKLLGRIIEKKTGSKETIIVSEKTGHVLEKKSEKNTEFSLSDEQIRELAENCKEIENLYGYPVDIEWCVSDGKIYILQARPVTTHIPIPDEMTTKPGEARLLYVDALITGQGVEKHFSILGSDYFYYYTKPMLGESIGEDFLGQRWDICFIHGKYYLNVSNLYASMTGRWILNKMNIGLDNSTVKTIMENLKNYKPKRLPKNLRFMFFKLFKGFKGMSSLKSYFAAYKDPEKYMGLVFEKEKSMSRVLKTLQKPILPTQNLPERCVFMLKI